MIPRGLVVLKAAGARRTGRTVCFRRGDLAPGQGVTAQVTVRARATTKVVRTLTGSARATDVAQVQASPRSVTILPRRR